LAIQDDLDAARALLEGGGASASANANEAFRRGVIALEQRVEELARENGAPSGDFHTNLVYLRDKDLLPGRHFQRLDRIRETRNCVFHDELDVPPLRAAAMLDDIESWVRASSANLAGLMTRHVRTVDAADPLERAEELILRAHVSYVPVLREGRAVGVISELAVLRAHRRAAPERTGATAGDAMEPPLPELPVTADVPDALALLEDHPALLLTDRGRPLGILSRWDMVRRYWHRPQGGD
jgi:predicted transcriptional regulator